ATGTPQFDAANGAPQSFAVGAAAITIKLRNLPDEMRVGLSITPSLDYQGDGVTALTSTTPATCSVTGGTVHLLATGVCTLEASASATPNFSATTATLSFVVK